MRYTFYLDESGSFDEKQRSLIAGYILPELDPIRWEEMAESTLKSIEKKYNIPNNLIRHRTDMKHKFGQNAEEISTDLLNLPQIQFIGLTEGKPQVAEDVYFWYVSMAADLIGGVLYKLLPTCEEPITEINFVLSARWDSQKGTLVDKASFQQAFEQAIEIRLLQLGISSANLKTKYDIHSADKYAPLVLADHFCNSLYNRKTEKVVGNLKDKIFYDKIRGEGDSSLHDLRRDYFNMISSYLLYKRGERAGGRAQAISQKSLISIVENMKLSYYKDERYFIAALRSILERTEYESNALKNYKQIIQTYEDLIKLIETLKPRMMNALIFTVQTELLAVANHSGNVEIAQKCIKQNEALIPNVLPVPELHSYLWVFYNISAVNYQGLYGSKHAIQKLKKAIEKREIFYLYQQDMLTDLGGEIITPDPEIGRFYGSLGQAYMMEYFLWHESDNIKLAQDCFIKAIDIFKNNPGELSREYNYQLRLARFSKNEQLFLDVLRTATGETSPLGAAKVALNGKDSFLKIELITGALAFEGSAFSEIRTYIKEHKDLFLTFSKVKSFLEVWFLREWAYLIYKENKSSKGLERFSEIYAWLGNTAGSSTPPLSLIKASSLVAEMIISGNDKLQRDIVPILVQASSIPDTPFAEIFKPFIDDPNMPNWALELKEKFYF